MAESAPFSLQHRGPIAKLQRIGHAVGEGDDPLALEDLDPGGSWFVYSMKREFDHQRGRIHRSRYHKDAFRQLQVPRSMNPMLGWTRDPFLNRLVPVGRRGRKTGCSSVQLRLVGEGDSVKLKARPLHRGGPETD